MHRYTLESIPGRIHSVEENELPMGPAPANYLTPTHPIKSSTTRPIRQIHNYKIKKSDPSLRRMSAHQSSGMAHTPNEAVGDTVGYFPGGYWRRRGDALGEDCDGRNVPAAKYLIKILATSYFYLIRHKSPHEGSPKARRSSRSSIDGRRDKNAGHNPPDN